LCVTCVSCAWQKCGAWHVCLYVVRDSCVCVWCVTCVSVCGAWQACLCVVRDICVCVWCVTCVSVCDAWLVRDMCVLCVAEVWCVTCVSICGAWHMCLCVVRDMCVCVWCMTCVSVCDACLVRDMCVVRDKSVVRDMCVCVWYVTCVSMCDEWHVCLCVVRATDTRGCPDATCVFSPRMWFLVQSIGVCFRCLRLFWFCLFCFRWVWVSVWCVCVWYKHRHRHRHRHRHAQMSQCSIFMFIKKRLTSSKKVNDSDDIFEQIQIHWKEAQIHGKQTHVHLKVTLIHQTGSRIG